MRSEPDATSSPRRSVVNESSNLSSGPKIVSTANPDARFLARCVQSFGPPRLETSAHFSSTIPNTSF
ncbi:hypothetical protein BKA67DRAFT_560693 [Truncatella angustata]|uniref:Uncharacterized protein n=1 Tax=Truncatella angustata TaxID=152316 RepID=A0A9P8ZYR5_9PEZI|nr:uncharacterized protein BKA67DRAFT_560693 [Truncatella angustata]KAH6655447.1 hypothetical protein BKA67DRAFT_560693 [Truncatella angustata]